MAISVSFPFSWVAQPGAREPSTLPGAVFSTASLNFLCTQLYNSSTPTQSLPITGHRNMHFHCLWNGMFDRHRAEINCHAVHRSLSSGASVCDCTRWILTLSHIVSQVRPCQRNIELPPSFEWYVWLGPRSILYKSFSYEQSTPVADKRICE